MNYEALHKRMTATANNLRREARMLGSGSDHPASGYTWADVFRVLDREKEKYSQIQRLEALRDPVSSQRSEYVDAHERRVKHRQKIAHDRNSLKRQRKAKRREYKLYKEHVESQDKRDRKTFGLIGWAVLCVGDSSIAANLRRRLESAMSPDARITSEEIDRVFWAVGGSKPYKDDIVRRIAHIIDEPEDLTIYAHQWNACTNLEQKQTLLDAWVFSTDKLIVIKDLAGTIRREKRFNDAPTPAVLQ